MSADTFIGQFISSTFQRLLQLSDNGSYITDGTGSIVNLIFTTSSHALTASYVPGVTATNPGGTEGSIQFNSSNTFQGSNNLTFNNSTNVLFITGSLILSGSANIAGVNYIDFLTTANPTHQEGRLHWTDDTKTLQVDTDVNNFMIELGHQSVVRVDNPYSFNLPIGTVVYISGSNGAGRPSVATASWEGDPTSAATLGFVAQTIPFTAGNKTGYVVTNGILRGVNTTGISVGSSLYLSSSGQFTNIVPDAPYHEVRLGKVIKSGADGIIYVNVMNGYELDELHDLSTTNATYGDLLMRSGSLWINTKQLSGSYQLTGSLNINGSVLINGVAIGSGGPETDPIFVAKSASFATTGSNTFIGNQYITGSVYITGSFGLTSFGNTEPTNPPSQVGLFYFTDTNLFISLQ